MSKNRVWNKGKRNGGGGTPMKQIPEPRDFLPQAEENLGSDKNHIHLVKPMKRDNPVTRPARVKPEKS